MRRGFLAAIGLMYLVLSAWCAWDPQGTSRAVGFELMDSKGRSEFLVVYVGLQLALGGVFLWPLVKPEAVGYCLGVCLAVFASLVLFRTLGFVVWSGFDGTTYVLAGVEWVVLLIGLAVLYSDRSGGVSA